MKVGIALLWLLLSAFPATAQDSSGFIFARLEYPGLRDSTYIKNWYTDYPDADDHIVTLLNRLTGISAASKKVQLTEDIYQYPFIYIVEPAQMNITDLQVLLLREYLDRGGFLMLDDIHGDLDLLPVLATLNRILPGRDTLVELDISHPVFSSFYDVDEILQVVNDGLVYCASWCEQWENGPTGKDPKVFAHYDDDGHMNIIMMHNNDIADGWQWLDDPNFPRQSALFSVKIFVNIVVFQLSH